MQLDHENLDVHAIAIDLVVLANPVGERLPRSRGYFADQVQRARQESGTGTGTGTGEPAVAGSAE